MIAAGVPTPLLFGIAGAFVLAIVCASVPQLGAPETAPATGQSFVWPERRLIALCLVALLGMLMEGAMADWSAVNPTSVIKLPAALAAGGAYASQSLFGRSFGDYAVRALGRMRIIMLGATTAAVGTFLAVVAPAAVAGFCLVGLGLSNLVPTVFSASAAMSSSPALGISMPGTASLPHSWRRLANSPISQICLISTKRFVASRSSTEIGCTDRYPSMNECHIFVALRPKETRAQRKTARSYARKPSPPSSKSKKAA